MSPNRRSNNANKSAATQQQHAHSQSHSLNLTPIKKSPTKAANHNLQSLVSTAASVKESKAMSNNSSVVNSQNNTDIKELRLHPQKSQQNNQSQQQYNLRSSHSNTLLQKQNQYTNENTSNSKAQTSRSRSQSPVKSATTTSNIKPFDSKNITGKENGNVVKANKTLNLKNTHNQITTNNKHPQRKSNFNNEDKQSLDMMAGFRFETQRINLPRGKVVRCSPMSSANGSKRNSQSPVKLPRNMPPLQDPNYEHKVDYFKEYWRMYFQNETLVADIEQTAHSNYKTLKKIYNLEDYYEHSLIPQLLTYPHKFLHRLRQQQLQKQQQQQKLAYQQKQQQELLLQMKNSKSDNCSNGVVGLGFVSDNKNSQGSSDNGHHHHISGNSSQNNEQSNACGNHNESSSGHASNNGHANQLSQAAVILGLSKDRMNKRKKHLRRTAAEIEREYICPYPECGKFYGSEGSLNLHIKIKHNGGNKTERERLAKTLVQAYVNGSINKELDSLDLNLPPGSLQKAVKKAGLVQQVSENEILRQITTQIHQHQVVVHRNVIGGDDVAGAGIVVDMVDGDDEQEYHNYA